MRTAKPTQDGKEQGHKAMPPWAYTLRVYLIFFINKDKSHINNLTIFKYMLFRKILIIILP